MATPKSRKLKVITFTLGGNNYEHQLKTWKLNNGTNAGNTTYVYGGNASDPTLPGAIVEDANPSWTLDLTFLADWANAGISDFLTVHDTETAAFQIDHHPNEVGEHVRWVGSAKIAAPSVGGDANATEETQVSLVVAGSPVYSRIG